LRQSEKGNEKEEAGTEEYLEAERKIQRERRRNSTEEYLDASAR